MINEGDVTMKENASLVIGRINNQTLDEVLANIWWKDSDVELVRNQSFRDVVFMDTVESNVNLMLKMRRANSIFFFLSFRMWSMAWTCRT